MAQKRPWGSDEDPIQSATKRLCVGLQDGHTRTVGRRRGRFHRNIQMRCHRRRHRLVKLSGTVVGSLRLLPHNMAFPLPTDIDVNEPSDIDLAEKASHRRMNKLLDTLLNCMTCFGRFGRCDAVNLTCGHKTNCSQCAAFVHFCTVCREPIRGTMSIEMPTFNTNFYTSAMMNNNINFII